MAGNRKKAEAFILEYIEKLIPGSENKKLYQETFKEMSDREFDTLMQMIEDDNFVFPIIAPNISDTKMSTSRNIAVAKSLGHEFFQQIWLTDPSSGTTYLTPLKYLVIDLPLRRQSQLLTKKMSLPDNNNHRDELTNQPTGPSKGSAISFPETQLLFALGLDKTIEELLKARGGDEDAFNKMNRDIIETGNSSLEAIANLGSSVKSTQTLSTLLKGMHLQNNL